MCLYILMTILVWLRGASNKRNVWYNLMINLVWQWGTIDKIVVPDATLCDKVCQWLASGRWFFSGTPISSTNKTDRHDIAELLLKVAHNTITHPKPQAKQPLMKQELLSLPDYLSPPRFRFRFTDSDCHLLQTFLRGHVLVCLYRNKVVDGNLAIKHD